MAQSTARKPNPDLYDERIETAEDASIPPPRPSTSYTPKSSSPLGLMSGLIILGIVAVIAIFIAVMFSNPGPVTAPAGTNTTQSNEPATPQVAPPEPAAPAPQPPASEPATPSTQQGSGTTNQ